MVQAAFWRLTGGLWKGIIDACRPAFLLEGFENPLLIRRGLTESFDEESVQPEFPTSTIPMGH
jgi:hypothetical protein